LHLFNRFVKQQKM